MHNTQSVIGIHIVLRFKLPATPAQSRCGKGAGVPRHVPREEPAEPGPLPGSESTKGQTNSGRDTFSIQRGREKRPGGRQELDEELLDEDELELLEDVVLSGRVLLVVVRLVSVTLIRSSVALSPIGS